MKWLYYVNPRIVDESFDFDAPSNLIMVGRVLPFGRKGFTDRRSAWLEARTQLEYLLQDAMREHAAMRDSHPSDRDLEMVRANLDRQSVLHRALQACNFVLGDE